MVIPGGVRALLRMEEEATEHGVTSGKRRRNATRNDLEAEDEGSFEDDHASNASSEEDESEEDVEAAPCAENDELATRVVKLAGMKCCDRRCLAGKEKALDDFLSSVRLMSKESQRTSMITSLAISYTMKGTKRQYGKGARERYIYVLPYCGRVCKAAFQEAYSVSNDTLRRARNQVHYGKAYVLPHGGTGNRNARKKKV